MARLAFFILSLLLALCASPALAQSASPSEALLDRFMASIPDKDEAGVPRPPSPEEVARMEGFNPGRSAEILPILQTYQSCIAAVTKDRTMTMIREVGRRLGVEKLQRLTEFYEGSEFVLFARLGERVVKGETLSAAEQAQFERLMTTYPLTEFHQLMRQLGSEAAADPELLAKFTKCSLAKRSDFDRVNLRYN